MRLDGMTQLAVSGASGKTGWRVVEEALKRGQSVRAIVRPASVLPPALAQAEQEGRLEVHRLELDTAEALLHALQGCTALVIATGARPRSIWRGPCRWMPGGCRRRFRPAAPWGCGVWCW